MNNRNLSYKAFLEALALVAFELDVEFDDVVAMLGVIPLPKEHEEDIHPQTYPQENLHPDYRNT